jgi:hypothetical protein
LRGGRVLAARHRSGPGSVAQDDAPAPQSLDRAKEHGLRLSGLLWPRGDAERRALSQDRGLCPRRNDDARLNGLQLLALGNFKRPRQAAKVTADPNPYPRPRQPPRWGFSLRARAACARQGNSPPGTSQHAGQPARGRQRQPTPDHPRQCIQDTVTRPGPHWCPVLAPLRDTATRQVAARPSDN